MIALTRPGEARTQRSMVLHSRHCAVLSACLIVLGAANLTLAADDTAAREAFARGEKLLAESKPDDAARAFESAARFAADPRLADRAELNRGVALLRAGDSDAAASVFGSIERAPHTTDAQVRAASQYHLGLIEHARAAAMIQPPAQDPSTQSPAPQRPAAPAPDRSNPATQVASFDEVLTTLRRAERRFRTAAELDPSLSDAARNVELTQRLIAAIKEEQQKQEQQQQQQQNDQQDQKQDQSGEQSDQQSDQGQSGQQKNSAGERSGERKDSDESGKQQSGQQQSSDQTSDQKKAQNKAADKSKAQDAQPGDKDQDKNAQKQSGQQKQDAEAQRAKDEQAQAEREAQQAHEAQGEPKPVRQFDPKAAQILDKEQREKAMLARLLRQLSGQPAQVEKDW